MLLLSQKGPQYFAADIRQPIIAALKAVSQSFVVQTEQV